MKVRPIDPRDRVTLFVVDWPLVLLYAAAAAAAAGRGRVFCQQQSLPLLVSVVVAVLFILLSFGIFYSISSTNLPH